MQMDRAAELRKNWAKKGNPPCKHEHIEKEYALGASTGDYVCSTCGQDGWGSDWNKKEGEKI
jgi:transposase-like protein